MRKAIDGSYNVRIYVEFGVATLGHVSRFKENTRKGSDCAGTWVNGNRKGLAKTLDIEICDESLTEKTRT